MRVIVAQKGDFAIFLNKKSPPGWQGPLVELRKKSYFKRNPGWKLSAR